MNFAGYFYKAVEDSSGNKQSDERFPKSLSEAILHSTRSIFIEPLEILEDFVLLRILSETSHEKSIWIDSNKINYFYVNEHIFKLNNDKHLIPDSFRRNGSLCVLMRWEDSKLEFKVFHDKCVYFCGDELEYNKLKLKYDWFEFKNYDKTFNFIEITPSGIRCNTLEGCMVKNKDILVYSKL